MYVRENAKVTASSAISLRCRCSCRWSISLRCRVGRQNQQEETVVDDVVLRINAGCMKVVPGDDKIPLSAEDLAELKAGRDLFERLC